MNTVASTVRYSLSFVCIVNAPPATKRSAVQSIDRGVARPRLGAAVVTIDGRRKGGRLNENLEMQIRVTAKEDESSSSPESAPSTGRTCTARPAPPPCRAVPRGADDPRRPLDVNQSINQDRAATVQGTVPPSCPVMSCPGLRF